MAAVCHLPTDPESRDTVKHPHILRPEAPCNLKGLRWVVTVYYYAVGGLYLLVPYYLYPVDVFCPLI